MPDEKVEVIDLNNVILPPGLVEKVTIELISKYHFIPIGIKDNVLTVVFGEIPNEKIINELKTATRYDVKFVLAAKQDVKRDVQALVSGRGATYKPSTISFSDSILQITRSQIVKYKNFINTVTSTQKKINYVIIGGVAFVALLFGVLLLAGVFSPANKSDLSALQQNLISQTNVAQTIYAQNHDAAVLIYTYDENGDLLLQGSGSIVRSDGVVLTNHHVIVGASGIKIFRDITPTKTTESQYEVEGIVFDDRRDDLALLKVKARNLPTVKVGNSDAVKAGDKVVVIGSPMHSTSVVLGLNTMNTLSEGMVSNKRENKIQITAQISHGSSGGPVFNARGEVIGIATLGIVADAAQSLNFAMPINLIKDKIAQKEFTPLGEYRYKLIADGWLKVGETKLETKEYDAAVEALNKALSIDPDFADPYNSLGLIYIGAGDNEKAIESFRKAISLEPDFMDAYFNLGLLYFMKTSEYENAISAFRDVVRLKPDLDRGHYWLGRAYLSSGDTEHARQELQTLKRMNSLLADELLKVLSQAGEAPQ